MPESRICPNCGTPAPLDFCPSCGQKQLDRRVTLRHLLADFFEDQFGLNAKAGRTLQALLFHPGRLSREYFDGHVERYVSPFKLYLLISVVFFVLVNAVTMRGITSRVAEQIDAAQDSLHVMQQRDSTIARRHTFGVTIGGRDTANWLRAAEFHTGWKSLDRVATARLQRIAQMGASEGTRQITRALFQQAPRVLFVLLPVYALLLYAFFWRRRRYYVEHFVFALHIHSFLFLVLVPGLLLRIIGIRIAVFAALVWYVLVAMRRFYEQSYLIVLVKSFFLLMCYWIVFAVGFMGAMLLALATV